MSAQSWQEERSQLATVTTAVWRDSHLDQVFTVDHSPVSSTATEIKTFLLPTNTSAADATAAASVFSKNDKYNDTFYCNASSAFLLFYFSLVLY